jgi:pimeloyl-ACP methyl ester carboxylesterase
VSDPAGLFALEEGAGEGPPIVFLHGFDGRAEIWSAVRAALGDVGCRTLAFDLPGHGRSQGYPAAGPAKAAARAVLAELDRRGVASAHLVGHSMGGAVAALVCLFAPARVASLTLLSPGGFGEAIGIGPIRAVMEAEAGEALRRAVSGMGAPGWQAPAEIASGVGERTPAARAATRRIFDELFASGGQGVLPLAAIAEKHRPVHVLWGRDDPVTPVAQADHLPPGFSVHRLDGVGHMPMLEAPEACAAFIRDALVQSKQPAGR